MNIRLWIAMAAGLGLVSGACADAGPSDLPDFTVHTVELTPAGPLALVLGDTAHLTVHPRTADGAILGSLDIEWSIGSADVAELSATALSGYVVVVSARAPGTTQVQAATGGRTAWVTVTVEDLPVHSVTVSPQSAEVEVGAEVQLEAVLVAADGTVLNGRVVTWSSGGESIATVDASGTVTAIAPGVVSIRASSEGVWAEGTVVVSDPAHGVVGFVAVNARPSRLWVGQSVRLEARVLDKSGQVMEGRTVTWSVETPGVASVDSVGNVSALNEGSTRIRATTGGVGGYAIVQSFARPVHGMALTFFGTRSDSSSSKVQRSVDTTWTDSSGVEHAAFLTVREGRLIMDWSGVVKEYEQVLVFQTYITESGQAKLVAETEHSDGGTFNVLYELFTGEPLFELTSTTTDNLTYSARFSLAGELVVDQPVGSMPSLPYYFHLHLP